MEWQWNPDAFDAIHLTSPSGEFEIIGTEGNQVLLEDDTDNGHIRNEPQIRGRWLVIQPIHGSGEWTLELPKSKPWVIEISAASGDVNIENLHAQIQVQLGSGEIHIEDCRGTFNLRSGNGDVEIENCIQAEVPNVPEFTKQEPGRAREPERESAGIPPIPPIPPVPPVPPAAKRFRFGKHVTIETDGDWEQYGRDWEEWGERFAEQAGRWAEKFAREFGNGFGMEQAPQGPGMHIRLGSGDVSMQGIDADLVTLKMGNGDLELEDGRIANLELETSRGDIDIDDILPAGVWDIATKHGDVQVILPDNTNARLDIATRHGDITSDVPLVGVGRPGRAARHGGRMVGTIGQVEEPPIEIHLETLHGDINVDLTGHNSRYAGQTAARTSQRRGEPIALAAPVPPVPPTPPSPEYGFGTTREQTRTDDVPDADTPDAAPAYDSQLAVLQALQKGEITVTEAEVLLKSLSH